MKQKNIILWVFNHIEECILSVTFTIMAIVCFVQVLTRYWFHYSMPWSEELLRALFVWSSCLGISLGFKTKNHLGVDAVVNILPKKVKKVMSFLAYMVVIIFCIFLIYYSLQITLKQYNTHQTTIAMRLPIFYISMSLPLGFTLTIIRILQVLKADFFTRESDTQHDEEEPHISEGLL